MATTRKSLTEGPDMVAQAYRFYFAAEGVGQVLKILALGSRAFPRVTASVHGLHRDFRWTAQSGILVSDQPDPRTGSVVELECRMTPRRLKRLELDSLRPAVHYFLLYDVQLDESSLRVLSPEEMSAALSRWEKFTGHDPLVWFEKRLVGKAT